ncbi:MAG: hypothetical protein J6U45_05980 [Alistipes sp.]|nr:hypothetical protein [Alistipes sp.]
MKHLLLPLSILLMACGSTESTDQLLRQVWTNDQSIRQQMLALSKAVTSEGRADFVDSLIVTVDEMERIDSENMAIVDSILQRGLPQRLTAESYKTIWIVIDHSSLEKQEQYLPLIEQMAHNGKIGLDEYALLYDRVALGQNRMQRYGSQIVQFGTSEKLQLYVWPIDNPSQLDSLRASVGLKPLAEYLQQIKEEMDIEPIYDPALTIEELNLMRNNTLQD